MKITLLQTHVQWQDAAANRAGAERLIAAAPASDVYVLPEMWDSGFCTRPESWQEGQSVLSLEWMRHTARRLGAVVAGSLAMRESSTTGAEAAGAQWRNRFYWVRPDGVVQYYDKRHLFAYAGEHLAYTAGQERVVVEWKGVRFMLQVCFDLRFPEGSRNALQHPYDVMLCVASWPEQRRAAWDILLQARAVENQAYMVGINRTGTDPHCTYNGGSAIVSPRGQVLRRLDAAVQTATFEPDLEALRSLRQHFPVLPEFTGV